MAAEEVPDELPAFLRRLDAVVGAVDREERVARVVEGVELVLLAVRAQLRLDPRDLLGTGFVSCAPNRPSSGQRRSGVMSIGATGRAGRELFGGRDDPPAVAVDRGVDVEAARRRRTPAGRRSSGR